MNTIMLFNSRLFVYVLRCKPYALWEQYAAHIFNVVYQAYLFFQTSFSQQTLSLPTSSYNLDTIINLW